MALSNKHPSYFGFYPDWTLLRHAYQGERIIKEMGQLYLPATSSMLADGMGIRAKGRTDYESYKMRAVYHDILRPAVQAMLGVMHRKPATIELPDQLEDMKEHASFDGEPLPLLLQKINERQLAHGRLGLLLDVPDGALAMDAMPYVVMYETENIYNWDATKVFNDDGMRRLQFCVLNESTYVRTNELAWTYQIHYRVLADAAHAQELFTGLPVKEGYVMGEATQTEQIGGLQFIQPSIAGNTLDSIPFCFVGPRDLVAEPDTPPLLGLARIALAIYRGEADYRDALFKTGQSTLVLIGSTVDPKKPQRIGANSVIDLPLTGDAKYVQAGADGLDPMRTAIQDDKSQASQLGANLLDQRGNAAESGAALQVRSAARTSSLTTVADAGAAALTIMLRNAAIWIGADPDKVVVEPNKDFGDETAVALDLVNLMTAKMAGAPLSKKSIHGWCAANDFTNMTWDEEQTEIDSEPVEAPPGGVPGLAGDPTASPAPKKKPAAAPAKTPPVKTKGV